ncbi:hypothetical protein H1R20_g13669, partial [Candolleomyces eurysporus]
MPSLGTFILLSLSFFNIALAAPKLQKRGVTTSPTSVNGKTYDYIVVGGGLTGITVAARLAENPSVTVLVIEAGGDDRNDPRVYDIYRYGEAFGSELMWNWPTDQGRGMIGGKTLGGGTSINGAAFTRGLNAQYDAWSNLLEPSEASVGWNWQGIWNYMKKSESFSPPNSDQAAKGAQYISSYHGYDGPVQVTNPNQMYGGPQQGAFINTMVNLTGINHYKDLNGGTPNCVSITPLTINWRDSDHRSSSVMAYLTPSESQRTNWITLTRHLVTKINWSNSSGLPLTATGVNFAPASGGTTRYTAHARREVILAAGAIQTPQLLQLSGIGDSAVLSPLGVPVRIDLKTVGKNLQEQTMSQLGAGGNGFNPGGRGPSNVIAYPNLYQLFGSQASTQVNRIRSSLASWAATEATTSGLSASALQQIFQIQADLIINNNGIFLFISAKMRGSLKSLAPLAELFFNYGYPVYVELTVRFRTELCITLSPQYFGFGHPDVESASFQSWKREDQKPTSIWTFKLPRHVSLDVSLPAPPMSSLSTGETIPGNAVPDNANRGSDQDWKNWIRANFNAVSHPVGTCAMMRRNLGGVVNAQLKVYDTANLRIVDASVMPTQVSAHLMSTLYGISEKAADLIKASWP